MITWTRNQAQAFLGVLRQALPRGTSRKEAPPVVFHAGAIGLSVRAAYGADLVVELRQRGAGDDEIIVLPAETLGEFGGRGGESVSLTKAAANTVAAVWEDHGVPQTKSFISLPNDKLPTLPAEPAEFAPVIPEFRTIWRNAVQTTSIDSTCIFLQRLQLRGNTGEIVATDRKQLLLQGGLKFPWSEDVLVPACDVAGSRHLASTGPWLLGKTDTHVCFRSAPWTFWLLIDKDRKFPEVESVIPALNENGTTLRLAPRDASYLSEVLPRLPGADEPFAPVTVDLNGSIAVRAEAPTEDGRPVEVVFNESKVSGPALRLVMDRDHLARALALGFAELHFTSSDKPVVSRLHQNTYVWVPLDSNGALKPSENALRLLPPAHNSPSSPAIRERKTPAMTIPPPSDNPPVATNGNGHPRKSKKERTPGSRVSVGGLIQEAESLQQQVRDVYSRTGRLVMALKKQRKQSKLLQGTLSALRELQQVSP